MICRLLVGAPEADARQQGVHKGGAVYKCSAQRPGDCSLIPFDTTGSPIARNGQPYDNKSGQWLGSLVASSGADGTIMVALHITTIETLATDNLISFDKQLNTFMLTKYKIDQLSGMCTTLCILCLFI